MEHGEHIELAQQLAVVEETDLQNIFKCRFSARVYNEILKDVMIMMKVAKRVSCSKIINN